MIPLYFASGSNRAADIRGFAAVGQPIGVAAPEVSPAAEAELVALAGTGLPVFVDSGAFSEVEFTAQGVKAVKPMTDSDWRRVLGLYRRLAVALGSQLSVVAPDRVGDQGETLARLRRYSLEMRALRALGVSVLVPIQKGSKTQAAFYRDVVEALGFDDFVHAIPSKKKATTIDELRAYLAEVRPKRVHFLGLGIRNANARAALEACAELVPGAELSFDSNLIAASVGRKNGPGGSRRALTRARDEASNIIRSGLTSILSKQELGIILAFGDRPARTRAVFGKAAA